MSKRDVPDVVPYGGTAGLLVGHVALVPQRERGMSIACARTRAGLAALHYSFDI